MASIGTAGLVLAAGGCATSPSTTGAAGSASGSHTITVVAAENFWGSIAAQLGGTHVNETSIIVNPDTDPHSYEPTADDARTVAGAQYVVANGIGYDPWVSQLLSSNPVAGRQTLTVGDLLGRGDGDNPHQWYSHDSVYQVIDRITGDYQKLDPADASYFAQQKATFENTTLAQYNQLEDSIRSTYQGTPIGASESIVSPLADSLGLNMLTPYSFLKDISEGTDPTAADKTQIDQQITGKQIKVYVYNSQNSTPDVAAQVNEAKAAGIPVTTVTETLAPANDSFEQWQVAQLQDLQAALHQATGK